MAAYLVRRIMLGLVSIWVISIIAFIIIQLPPGDYFSRLEVQEFGDHSGSAFMYSPEVLDILRARWGMDKPLPIQYAFWFFNVIRGDLGLSIECLCPVREVINDRILLTLAVASASIVFTWTLAIPIGIYSAVRQYSVGDHFFTFFGFIGLAVPNFLLALVLMVVTVMWLGQSVGGLFSAEYIQAPWSLARMWDLVKHLWMPALVLGTAGTAVLIRIMRANLLDELRKPYVVTARAKGLSEHRIILKYPVRVAANPLVSGMAFLLPNLFSGEVIVAVVMSLPTLGPTLLGGLINQDSMLSGSIILILGSLTVLGMIISDIMLVILDPRIRLTGSR